MQFTTTSKPVNEVECDVLVVGLFEGAKDLAGVAETINETVGKGISALIEREKFEGKIGQTTNFTPTDGVSASNIVVVGLGKDDEFNSHKLRQASGASAKKARDLSAKKVATTLCGVGDIAADAAAQTIVEGAVMGTYQYTRFKTEDVKPNPIEQIEIIGDVDARTAIDKGRIVAESVNLARDLINGPANLVTPTYLAEQAKAVATEFGLDCRVIEPKEMKTLGMNLLLCVAQAGREEPRFIALKYTSPNAKKTVALVGKGLTFDAGGLCLKSSGGLEGSKDDMSGGAAVLAAMRAVAALKPNVNVLGIIPSTENMIGGNATRPGDVITGLSGKSVEINNMDAEGRLILADGVTFAENEGADEIIDIATLTGACVGALGKRIAGIMGTDQGMIDKLIAAGDACGEKLWQLPLHDEYEESLKSDIADMKNCPNEAGIITAAFFIKKHIKETPWAHLDIAGPCCSDKDTPLGPKGGAGFGVLTFLGYLQRF
jgi:leucyl aminopeptidase